MRTFVTRINFLWIMILFVFAAIILNNCGKDEKKGRSETFYFIDDYPPMADYKQTIDMALKPEADLNQITSGMLEVYRNLDILNVFQKYNKRNAADLTDAFEEYQDFLEGTFFYYYNALLNLEFGKKEPAIKNIAEFLKHHRKNDVLRSIAKDYLALLKDQISIEQFWRANRKKRDNLPLIMASIQALNKQSLTKLIDNAPIKKRGLSGLLKQLQKENISSWQLYRSTEDMFKPLYKETIVLKQRGKSKRESFSFVKKFYYPYEYDVLIQLYKIVLKRLVASFLAQNPQQIAVNADTTWATQFFYFTFHLSDMYKFGLMRQSRLLLKQLEGIARTPLQKKLVLLNQTILEGGLASGNKIDKLKLESGYVPYLQVIFRALQLRNMSEAGLQIDQQDIEQCKAELYKYSPGDNYTLHGLGYLGEAYLELGEWNNAKTYLNYLVQDGWSLESNDATNLSKLALAIYNERSQIPTCNWILKNLRDKYSYVNPLLDNTKFIVSAKFSK